MDDAIESASERCWLSNCSWKRITYTEAFLPYIFKVSFLCSKLKLYSFKWPKNAKYNFMVNQNKLQVLVLLIYKNQTPADSAFLSLLKRVFIFEYWFVLARIAKTNCKLNNSKKNWGY